MFSYWWAVCLIALGVTILDFIGLRISLIKANISIKDLGKQPQIQFRIPLYILIWITGIVFAVLHFT